MSDPLQVLIIEDDESDAELLCIELQRGGFEPIWHRVDNEPDLVRALEQGHWDLIVSDFAMPGFDGLRAFDIYREKGLDIPFIFVSGALGEDRAVEAMRVGARDYLLKGNLARLTVAVRRELQAAQDRQRQKEAEERAHLERWRLNMAVEAGRVGVFDCRVPVDAKPYFNDRFTELFTMKDGPLPSAWNFPHWFMEKVHREDQEHLRVAFQRFLEGHGERMDGECRLLFPNGQWLEVAVSVKAVERTPDGSVAHIVGVVVDFSEQRRLEAQLRHSQKMEAVGRLAGGVAHDFNNLLTAILSFGNFVMEELPQGTQAHEDIQEVLKAARRAESLTGQLLAFSRRKPINPEVMNLNATVKDTDRMLRRILGEDIELHSRLAPDLWNVRIDSNTFEQVLLNLAVNARDAMPEGGHLSIETRNVTVHQQSPEFQKNQVPSGDYVLLSMADTGIGMDAATQARMFEPFFTTKELGKGTGLGLSMCYGIVQQAEGHILVSSEPGQGANFMIYLPKAGSTAEVPFPKRESGPLRGGETLLVVEDDEQVRRLIVRTLTGYGYTALEAPNGAEALKLAERQTPPIALLVTDVVMPGMSGVQLADQLVKLRPELKVLFVSGYAPGELAGQRTLKPGNRMMQKPFTSEALARIVREVLDE